MNTDPTVVMLDQLMRIGLNEALTAAIRASVYCLFAVPFAIWYQFVHRKR